MIGFWVGLAVFVIFMFFLLTLLTKTGAPHPDTSQPCEKQPRLIGFTDTNLNNEVRLPHLSGLDSSSLFQCYVSTETHVSSRALWITAGGVGGGTPGGCQSRPCSGLEVGDGTLLQELAVTANGTEKEAILLTHFSIPNCVSSDQSSPVGEDDLLLGEPELSVILEGRDQIVRNQNDHDDFR